MSGYCGCCGHGIRGRQDYDPLWCHRCKGHVGIEGADWDRTYESVHGVPCPFQVGAEARDAK